ncbi:signal peptidase I [Lysinibacillus sp. LZ02]|uniref:signal peptidase I n=1 Tax=Lysinibacillus sp. LZ02 TaxID=3420668 RepID=UPI003D36DC39
MEEKQDNWLDWVKTIGIAFVLAVGVRYFIFTPIVVQGASMMPTLEDGEMLAVDKITPKLTDLERFDVIVFKETEEENYVKRVIGLPGDHIQYIDDVLYVNGEKYDEPYLDKYKAELKDPGTLTEDFTLEDYLQETTVPEGHLFVLGDNRRVSIDSRLPAVGFVPMDTVIGEVRFVYWPLSNAELISN